MADNTNGDLITETYTLPSRGLIYDKPVNPTVTLRSMTLRDERKRLNYTTEIEREKAMADVIEECIVGDELGIPVYDLCYGDFKFLENRLRVVSLGKEYKVEWVCPYCNEYSSYVVDLDTCEVNSLTEFDKSTELTVTLPVSQKKILLQFETPRIVKETLDDVDKMRKKFDENGEEFFQKGWTLTYQLVHATKLVDGKALRSDQLVKLYDGLTLPDIRAIVNALKDFNGKVGLGGSFSVRCNQCGNAIDIPFRITREFWEPSH